MIVRVDGKAFHSYCRHADKPWDLGIVGAMKAVASALSKEQGAKLAYVQSDEVSVLFTDYDSLTTDAWFDKNLQKLVSVSASIATRAFNLNAHNPTAIFDARAFVLPKEEVCNYFIWRQQDAVRNSIQSLAQANFSHKSLQNLSGPQLQEKLWQEKGINWNDCEVWQKRGLCVVKGEVDSSPPTFTEDRNYIEQHVYLEEES
jgi:tRNA(His) guanylyltransferase